MAICDECGRETTDIYRVFLPPKAHAKPEQKILCAVDCYPRYVRRITPRLYPEKQPRTSSNGALKAARYYVRPRIYQELRT